MALSFHPLSDFNTAVALGVMKTTNDKVYRSDPKFARMSSSTATTRSGLKPGASGPFYFRTKAVSVRIKSGGNAADHNSSTGAQSVTVLGIDEDLKLATEAISTKGATASTFTTTKFWRVFDAWVVDAGLHGGANVGDIAIENDLGIQIITIEASMARSHFGSFSTPDDFTGLVNGVTFHHGGAKEATFFLVRRERLNVVVSPLASAQVVLAALLPPGTHSYKFENPILVPRLSDFWIDVEPGALAVQHTALLDYKMVP